MLSQGFYYTDHGADDDGWFAVTQEEITAITGLSDERQLTVRRELVARGYWEEEKRGEEIETRRGSMRTPGKLHYRLDLEAIRAALEDLVESAPHFEAELALKRAAAEEARRARNQRLRDARRRQNGSSGDERKHVSGNPGNMSLDPNNDSSAGASFRESRKHASGGDGSMLPTVTEALPLHREFVEQTTNNNVVEDVVVDFSPSAQPTTEPLPLPPAAVTSKPPAGLDLVEILVRNGTPREIAEAAAAVVEVDGVPALQLVPEAEERLLRRGLSDRGPTGAPALVEKYGPHQVLWQLAMWKLRLEIEGDALGCPPGKRAGYLVKRIQHKGPGGAAPPEGFIEGLIAKVRPPVAAMPTPTVVDEAARVKAEAEAARKKVDEAADDARYWLLTQGQRDEIDAELLVAGFGPFYNWPDRYRVMNRLFPAGDSSAGGASKNAPAGAQGGAAAPSGGKRGAAKAAGPKRPSNFDYMVTKHGRQIEAGLYTVDEMDAHRDAETPGFSNADWAELKLAVAEKLEKAA